MKNINRRSFIKKGMSAFLYSLIATGMGYLYARFIEPNMLSVSYHTISSPLIQKGLNGLKIIQFSDLHLGYHYSVSRLNDVVEKINEEKPDIVFFTGDLIDDQRTYENKQQIAPILRKIQSSIGKFSIYGNHDHGGYGTELYAQIMSESGFLILQNEERRIRLIDGSELSIIGIDDILLGQPKIKKTIHKASEQIYTILLVHEPDVAPTISNYPINLQLSGHSHGGQVQIPFFGPYITPPLAKTYIEGFYYLKGENGNVLTVYVNRGLGTTRVPFRFLAKPEITVFTLKHR